jgi:cephalosporin hydroxylase
MSSPITVAGNAVILRGKPLTTRGVRRLGHLLRSEMQQTAAFWLNRQGVRRSQEQAYRRCRTSDDYYDFSVATFGLDQVRSEILSFLDFAQSVVPVRACEIGTQQGGTNFLLSQALPSVSLMIGIDLFVRRRFQLRHFSRLGQRISFVDGSSYAPESVARVRQLLGHHKLDLLFVDGDHSYEGVKQDFLKYRHLVRDGGIIAFHDVVPDFRTRFGIETPLWVGDVPRFWATIREIYPSREFVQDPEQDGFGIGAITYTHSVAVPPDL